MSIKINPLWHALAFILLLGSNSCKREKSNQSIPEKIEPIESLDQLRLKTASGTFIDWSDYKDKVVFINFWATWCGPCIKEMPSIERLKQKLSAEEVIFLFATEEDFQKIGKFKNKHSFNLTFVQQQTNLAHLEILALPTTFIFDKAGKLVFRETSVRQWDDQENVDLIKGYL